MKKASIETQRTPYTQDEFYSFFKQLPAGIAIFKGPEHVFILVNDLYKKILNREGKNLLGKTIREVFPEVADQGVYEVLDSVYTSGKTITASEFPAFFYRSKKRVKEKGYFNFVAQAIRDKDKTIQSVLVYVYEVTDQVLMREKMQRSEQYYRSLLEYSADVTSLRDRKGNLIYVTSSIKKILGYTPEEYMQYNKWDIIHPDDISNLKKIYEKARKRGGKPFRYQNRVRHKNGTWRWVEGVGTDLMDDPVVQGVVSNFRDITHEKEAEERLEQSEERLRTATTAATVGTWRTDLSTGMTTRDASLNILLGFKPQVTVVPRETFITYVHPDDREAVDAGVKDLFVNKKDLDLEFRFIRPDGKIRWVRDRGKLIACKNKKSLIAAGAMVDITEQKNLERQKDEFLGIASHELKTPVTSIKAYTQVLNLRFRKAGDSASAELVSKMDGQLDKLSMLINDLLDVTKIESGKLLFHEEYFDVNELITEICEETQRTSEKHKLVKKLASSKTMWGDRDRIGQVLMNLLTNAMKYSPKTSDIIIKTSVKKDTITFSVQDFGMGIPKHKQKHIFDRFFRVQGEKQETYPGLGLGLYISHEIVQRHKGRIWFESTRGKGSTFYFSLPLTLPIGEKEV